MKIILKLDQILHKVNLVLFAISAVLMTFMVLLVGTDITLRNLFNAPIGWVKEISEYIIFTLAFLLPTWVMESDGHIKMDLITSKLPAKERRVLNIITYSIAAIIMVVLFITAWKVMMDALVNNIFVPRTLRPPYWIFVALMCFGFLAVCTQILLRIYHFAAKPVGREKPVSRGMTKKQGDIIN